MQENWLTRRRLSRDALAPVYYAQKAERFDRLLGLQGSDNANLPPCSLIRGGPKMRHGMPVLTALIFLAGAGLMVTATTYAQTSGGERRDDRRDDRQGARAQKKACKAGDEKSRSECRKEKRDTKHSDSPPTASPAPTTTSPTPK